MCVKVCDEVTLPNLKINYLTLKSKYLVDKTGSDEPKVDEITVDKIVVDETAVDE